VGLLDQFRRALTGDPWAPHQQRAGSLVADLERRGAFDRVRSSVGPIHRAVVLPWDEAGARTAAFGANDPDVVGSALMLMVRNATGGLVPDVRYWGTHDPAAAVWVVSREDALLAARSVVGVPDDVRMAWPFTVVARMFEKTSVGDPAAAEATFIEALLDSLDTRASLTGADRRSLRKRFRDLLPRSQRELADVSAIVPRDSWSAMCLPILRSGDERTSGLLRHLDDAKGSKPGTRWLGRAREVLDDPGVRPGLEQMVRALAAAPSLRPSHGSVLGLPCVVCPDNVDIARAAAWAASQVEEDWVVPALHAAAARGLGAASTRVVDPDIDPFSGDKVLNAAILALGLAGTPEAIAALQRLSLATRHNGVRTRISAALDAAADRSGLTRGQLVERMVSADGFDVDGLRGVEAAPGQARLVLESPGDVRLEWAGANGWTTSSGADVDQAVVAAARRELKTARATVAAERQRLEGLMGADRQWSYDEWCRYYRDHPVTGRLARALIWSFSNSDGTGITGMPLTGDQVIGTDNEARQAPEESTVRLWHPARASTDDVQAWRGWLMDAEIRQPFKQAFREIYVLTPAELETRLHSNRFAAHVVRYQQMYALTKERAWVSNYLGPYDGGYDGTARRDLPDVGLTAVFQHYPGDAEAGAFRIDYATTDRVWFYRAGDRQREPVPLVDVPPLAFSEAMRDVDLFVGVCSIALDPTWGLRQEDGHYAYWNQVAFGELTAAGDVRRDVLLRLVPKLKVSDRVEVLDRYVRVRGNLATYRIHLGSANILIEPDDRYLCIVPAGKTKAPRLLLPFDGDEILSVILSKIVMLAQDDKITDDTILHQIRRR
jgi:hypothetical protein